jgi:diguanylate cyclase (GGDEF)-like protein
LAELPLNSYGGTEFFAWQDGVLYALGAARFEVVDGGDDRPASDLDVVRLVMGRRVNQETVEELANHFMLSGLEVVNRAPADRPYVQLSGGDGEPVAYLAWDVPRPGTTILWRMVLPLVLVVLVITGLAGLGMVLVRRGARALIRAEQRASDAARRDDMTGLPNRLTFNQCLLARAAVGERAILFLDVNDFKRVNDSIGHAAGDQVIKSVAQRLSVFAASDCFLARLAGDEFVFVVIGPNAEFRTKWLAVAIDQALSRPFRILGHEMRLSMSMGYAVQTSNDTTGDDLLRQADLAMYEAKRHKGGPPVAFSALIEQATRDASVIERGLRKALQPPGELSVLYQPIVAMDGRMVRAEALARWTSADLGAVPPDRFIPVAEQAGLVVELGRKLFQCICDDLVSHPDLLVSVNISTIQLMAPDFIPSLMSELTSRGLDPGRIEVELTEGVLVDDTRLAAQRLDELHAAGFSTALDDFGTGYSSVGYLRKLRFDTLKIDRSFISGFCQDPEQVGLVEAMILMAHNLRLRVVCEGIETAEELELLRNLGCDLAQGYHLDRPLPIQALAARWLGHCGNEAAVA